MISTFILAIALAVANISAPPSVILQRVDSSDWNITYYNLDPTQFVWSIQTSTNLAGNNWADEPSATSGTGLVISRNGRSTLFIRLKGVPIQ